MSAPQGGADAIAPTASQADELARLRERVARLEHELSRLRGVIRQAGDMIVVTDLEGKIIEFNEEAEHVLGWRADEVLGGTPDRFYVSKSARARLLAKLTEESGEQPALPLTSSGVVVDRGSHQVVREDVEVKTKAGERRWLNLSLSWLLDASGRRIGTVGVSKDVTARRNLEEELRRLSVTDKLTGLFNQSHFFHRLEVEKERALRLRHDLSLLLFDLDGFKKLNDTQGHREGDKVLIQIGRVLFESIRKEVDSAFRYGGDEFTVLLPGADRVIAVRFAERVRRRIEELDMSGVRASMGVCPFDPKNRALQVVEKADEAMYLSKRAGGNRVAAYDLTAGAVALCNPEPPTGAFMRPGGY